MSMNVQQTQTVVSTSVPTQMDRTYVAVGLGTAWVAMEGTALVWRHHTNLDTTISDCKWGNVSYFANISTTQISMSVQLGLTTVNRCAPIHRAHSHAPVALDLHSTVMDAHAKLVSWIKLPVARIISLLSQPSYNHVKQFTNWSRALKSNYTIYTYV